MTAARRERLRSPECSRSARPAAHRRPEVCFGGAEIEGRAAGGVAEVSLRHLFVNEGDAPLEVIYHAPIPPSATLQEYAFCFGSERFIGKPAAPGRARPRYDAALANGCTAAFIEPARNSAFLTQRVGNIPPGLEVITELRLTHPLEIASDRWRWRFPTVIGRRESASENGSGAADISVAREAPPARVSVRLWIEGARGTTSSSSHSIITRAVGGEALVRLANENGERLNRDVVIDWLADSGSARHLRGTMQPPAPGHPSSVVASADLPLEPHAPMRRIRIPQDRAICCGG